MTPVGCPRCGSKKIVRFEIVPAMVQVEGITANGTVRLYGGTELDWDGQRPAHTPPRYACKDCCLRISHKRLCKQGET